MLRELLKNANVTDDDLIIFLGGYVGFQNPENELLSKFFMENFNKENFIFLHGFGDRRDSTPLIEKYISQMGTSYSLKIGGRDYLFCYGYIDINVPLDSQPETLLIGHEPLPSNFREIIEGKKSTYESIWDEFMRKYKGDTVIISGQCPPDTSDNMPYRVPRKNIFLTDTCPYDSDSSLYCVDILTGEYWSAKNKGSGEGIIFVCSGNVCRSPMAKYIMKNLLPNADIYSAGCSGTKGRMMDRGVVREFKKNNIPFDRHLSDRFYKENYSEFEKIIVFDKEDFQKTVKISGGDPDNKISMLKDVDGNNICIEAPTCAEDYSVMFEKIYRACELLAKTLK